MLRRLIVLAVLVCGSLIYESAYSDSKSMRKKAPISFGVSLIDESDGVLETALGYNFGNKIELSLVASRGSSELERNFTNEFTLPEYAYLFGGRSSLVQASLRGRVFLGNSLSFLVGIGARRISYELGIFDDSYLWYLFSKLRSEEIVGTLALGNQWSFDSGLFFGIDWGFYTMPIVGRESVSYESYGLGDSQINVLGVPMADWLYRISHSPRRVPPALHIGFRF